MAQKFFTAEEANSALALVRPIVDDLLRRRDELLVLQNAVSMSTEEKSAKFQSLGQKIQHHVDELEALGCVVKDLEFKLVDFPCLYEGRMVYLCWQYGEERVLNWHEFHSGFRGRKPIDRSFKKSTLFS